MKTLWRPDLRDEITTRVSKLRPESPALWGKMTAPEMICHVADQLRVALGDRMAEPVRSIARFWPLKLLVIYVVPPPKGKVQTVKEMLVSKPTTWQADAEMLLALVARFATEDRDRAWPDHPAFGKMSARAWGALGYRHIDHHLRQFGV